YYPPPRAPRTAPPGAPPAPAPPARPARGAAGGRGGGAEPAGGRRGPEPGGAGHHQNLDWDVQEVMTGASIPNWLRYRALWFSLLSQGLFRAGTANSDTHSLGLERIGYPRNIVFDVQSDPLDVERFDEAVRSGHMVGTNGPVLDVSIIDGAASYRP